MARPRTPIGTHGEINLVQIEPAKWRARTRYRYQDGKLRQIERIATTKAKAENALKAALVDIEIEQGGAITSSMKLGTLGKKFLQSRKELGRSEGTIETYGYAVEVHIAKHIGDLTIAEAKPERLQKFLNTIENEHGAGAAKNCRSALSGMLGLAVRNGALMHNPVRELERITHRKKGGSKAIPPEDLSEFIKKIRANEKLIEWDTVELIEFMLATGWRVGEVCALDEASIDFKNKTATVEANAIRIKGKGVVRQEFPKTDASRRVTPLTDATLAMLQRRKKELGEYTTLLFPTPLMKLRDPSNTQREVRDVRNELGYPQLSTHSFRKTVATLLDKEGLSAVEIANYLGHKNPSVTQDVYMNTIPGGEKARDAIQKTLNAG